MEKCDDRFVGLLVGWVGGMFVARSDVAMVVCGDARRWWRRVVTFLAYSPFSAVDIVEHTGSLWRWRRVAMRDACGMCDVRWCLA